jgi:predicted nucleotidyltransferase
MGAALFASTQQRVLALLFGQPGRVFGKSEFIALAGGGSAAVQREIARLVEGGLAIERVQDGRKHVKANPDAPLFAELCGIINKTAGVSVQLRAALAELPGTVTCAVLFGSVAKGTDTARSDIDVLIVADGLALEEVYRAVAPVEQRLGPPVNPTLYTWSEFREAAPGGKEFKARRASGNSNLKNVLDGKHTVLLGRLDGKPRP